MTKPIAIRSLQCRDHAENIVPNVLSVSWMIGKRCNFDCYYCSPHAHDTVSPWLDLPAALKFVALARHYCKDTVKTIKWGFTGGEPFLDPGFLLLCEHVAANNGSEQMNVTTNGSAAAKVYDRAADIFSGITVSLHLERTDDEIDQIIGKCTAIKRRCGVSVNLMFLPGHSQRVRKIIEKLRAESVPFVLRKITPQIGNQENLPYTQLNQGRKSIQLHDLSTQTAAKIRWKTKIVQIRDQLLNDYYSTSELQLLQQENELTQWQNCGVWFSDGDYREVNTDHLLANDLVNFKGWHCYAGVDHLYINFDGQIYRASCLNSGAIGHIKNSMMFLDTHTICDKTACLCNQDIAIRKSLPNAVHHVNI